jgi:hypothetical protein
MYKLKDGKLRLLGFEYIIFVETPTLGGQVMHYTGSPNRYGIPAFYALHVWAWRANPSGVFADWNTKVSCDEFTGIAAKP